MKKEFLNLDEFMALLASHGYEWGSTETTNLLLEAFYSEGITPVFFYDGIIGWGCSYWNGALDKWVRVKEGFSTLRGYFSIHQSDLIEHYRDMESIKEKWYFGSRIRVYKTYGEPPPTLSDNDTSFGYNSRIELGKQAPLSELEKIEHCYIYIYDDDYQLAFNELLYPIEQVEKILTPFIPDDTATPAQLASLTHEINEAKAIIAQQKERIAELEQAQASQPNEELHPKTLKTVSHLLNVLFDKARFDIDAHMGTTNSQIVELSNKLNTPITKKPVSYWIKQVKQLRIDKNIG